MAQSQPAKAVALRQSQPPARPKLSTRAVHTLGTVQLGARGAAPAHQTLPAAALCAVSGETAPMFQIAAARPPSLKPTRPRPSTRDVHIHGISELGRIPAHRAPPAKRRPALCDANVVMAPMSPTAIALPPSHQQPELCPMIQDARPDQALLSIGGLGLGIARAHRAQHEAGREPAKAMASLFLIAGAPVKVLLLPRAIPVQTTADALTTGITPTGPHGAAVVPRALRALARSGVNAATVTMSVTATVQGQEQSLLRPTVAPSTQAAHTPPLMALGAPALVALRAAALLHAPVLMEQM